MSDHFYRNLHDFRLCYSQWLNRKPLEEESKLQNSTFNSSDLSLDMSLHFYEIFFFAKYKDIGPNNVCIFALKLRYPHLCYTVLCLRI